MLNKLLAQFLDDLNQAETVYGLSSSVKRIILIAPAAVLFAAFLFLSLPVTRESTLWLLEENHPVETLTFLALIGGGFLGGYLALRLRRQGARWLVGFYGLFSLALVLVGLEEVAWGQSLLGFQTPQAIKEVNAQGELTLHNLEGLQGHSEIFRLVFGMGGLIGVMAGYLPSLRKVSASTLLLPWFLVITAHAALDIYDDRVPLGKLVSILMRQTSEVVELLIGGAGLLYLWLNLRRLYRPVEKDQPR